MIRCQRNFIFDNHFESKSTTTIVAKARKQKQIVHSTTRPGLIESIVGMGNGETIL